MPIQVTRTHPLARILERIPETRRRRRPERLATQGSVIRPGGPGGWIPAVAGGGGPPRARLDPVHVLVNRITQGFNLAEHERARALGYEAYLEEQLDHLGIDDSEMDARLSGFATLAMSPRQILDNYPTDITQPYYQVKGAALLRAVFSKRQLFERMVEFWSDHFNVDHNKGDTVYLFKPEEDRLVFRAHALETFGALLAADAFNAAMLYYLDNWLNFAGAIQENYARELMELHTLGVDGGYSEDDVREVARCFTGWTLNGDPGSADYLRGTWELAYHEGGNKVVLGVPIPANPPRQNAQHVLDILGAHPSTARFVSRKLIQRFLNENPPQAFVDQVAQTFLDSGGDVKQVLRAILARENLAWNSPVLGPKFRRPFHLMASILRGLGANVTDYFNPIFYLGSMGHVPFDWSPPTGYPDTVDAWGQSLLARWKFLSELMQGGIYGVQIPATPLLELLDVPAGGAATLAHRINRRILGQALPAAEEVLVQQFIDSQPNPLLITKVYEAIALAASMPGYQWY